MSLRECLQEKFHPGMKSSLSMADEISSMDEKKSIVNTSFQDEILQLACSYLIFDARTQYAF